MSEKELQLIRGGLSIGFRCKRTNVLGSTEFGFITAKHGFKDTSDWVKYNATSIGERTLSYNVYDCAFVKITNSNYQVYNDIGNTAKKLYDQQLGAFAQGTPVWKYGNATGETSGTVAFTTTSCPNGNYNYYTDVFESTYYSAGGDSGGPVYVYGTTVYQSLIGIHVASGGYAQKAANIVSLMNLTRY